MYEYVRRVIVRCDRLKKLFLTNELGSKKKAIPDFSRVLSHEHKGFRFTGRVSSRSSFNFKSSFRVVVIHHSSSLFEKNTEHNRSIVVVVVFIAVFLNVTIRPILLLKVIVIDCIHCELRIQTK